MDMVLNTADYYVLTPHVYPTWWKEDDMTRQLISLYAVLIVSWYTIYFVTSTFSYLFIFDRRLLKHPKILKNQVKLEIMLSCKSIPLAAIPGAVGFLLQVRGYSKLYDSVDTKLGFYDIILSAFTVIMFTDAVFYWMHRFFLHHRFVYKHVHKPHHELIVPTPFASHAFHPLDLFLEGVLYLIYPFAFPIHKSLYLCFFVFANIWTAYLHEGAHRVPAILKPIINGSAHHTDHHLFYNYNYGQYFTLWDKIGGTHRWPSSFDGEGPAKAVEELEKPTTQNGHTYQHGKLDSKKTKQI